MAIADDIPLIDIAPLISESPERERVSRELGAACREHGFFYIAGHGVDPALCQQLEALSRQFFARGTEEKMRINMARGGRAWRGRRRSRSQASKKQHECTEGEELSHTPLLPQPLRNTRVEFWAHSNQKSTRDFLIDSRHG